MGGSELDIFDKRGRHAGQLQIDHLKIDMKPSLLAYLRGGWSIDCSIAVDFTLSNLPITAAKSKHRQDKLRKGDMNQYEKAIYEVGGVLQKFAHKEKFTMYGFGGIPRYLAKTVEDYKVVKCWNLGGEPDPNDTLLGQEVQVDGVMGALGLYHEAVCKTTFAGPTYFAGILRRF